MWKFVKKNWLIILSLIYILSPIDFIPELLLGPLGLIDDIGLVILLLLKALYDHQAAKRQIIDVTTEE